MSCKSPTAGKKRQQAQRFGGKDFQQVDFSRVDLPPGKLVDPLQDDAPLSPEFLEEERKAEPVVQAKIDVDELVDCRNSVELSEELIRQCAAAGDIDSVIRAAKEYAVSQAVYTLRKFVDEELRGLRCVHLHSALKSLRWLRVSNKTIARECGKSEKTVERWVAEYNKRHRAEP